jgi:hypothetical protein
VALVNAKGDYSGRVAAGAGSESQKAKGKSEKRRIRAALPNYKAVVGGAQGLRAKGGGK